MNLKKARRLRQFLRARGINNTTNQRGRWTRVIRRAKPHVLKVFETQPDGSQKTIEKSVPKNIYGGTVAYPDMSDRLVYKTMKRWMPV